MRIERVEYDEDESLATVAGLKSLEELENDRRSVILMPRGWAPVALDMGVPPDGIYIRFDTKKESLCSLCVDTLILVAPRFLENDEYAVDHLLLGASDPKILLVGKGGRWVENE